MTLGEIKIEALKLMFAEVGDLSYCDIEELENSLDYGVYLRRMNGSINRAFGRIENAGAVPYRIYKLKEEEGETTYYYAKYNLPTLIPDYNRLERLVREKGYSYNGNAAYCMEGETLVLPRMKFNESYTVIYSPKIARVTEEDKGDKIIDLPEDVLAIIPYFVKADVYEEEEPSLSANARALFEQNLKELARKQESRIYAVNSLYGGCL